MVIQFYIQGDKNPTAIYLRFRDGRTFDLRRKTGLVINPKNWAAKKWNPGQPKTNLKNEIDKAECNTLSEDLTKLERLIKKKYNETQNKLSIDNYWIDAIIKPNKETKSIPNTLVDYFDYYIASNNTEIGKSTITKINVVKHLVEKMEGQTNSRFSIADVDEAFKNKYVEFATRNGYAINTIARTFSLIKTICYHAEYNGIAISPKLKKINLKKQKVPKIYLTLEELKLIEKVKLDHDYLDNARDWLLISCDIGQRVSDLLRFTKDMIRKEAGKSLIEFTQTKTKKIMTIPLSKRIKAILKKRKGEFPRKISDQKYNDYIKEVCEKAELTYRIFGTKIDPDTKRKVEGEFPKWELISSHVGRRSFATNNYGRVPTSLLIGATGHSTEKMFLEYIGKTDTQKALQLAEWIK